MNKTYLLFLCLIWASFSYGQKTNGGLTMTAEYSSDNPEIRDILRFEGIEYQKIKFTGKELANKSYQLTVKEIWDGKIVRDTVVFDSKSIGIEQFEKVNDTVLSFKVISKLTHKNKLRVSFAFRQFGVTKEYEALDTDDYSLRNLVKESDLEIGYGKKFHFLAYILPYEREDGSKSWCEVGSNGKDVENWGKKYGIKHYLLFEMKFE